MFAVVLAAWVAMLAWQQDAAPAKTVDGDLAQLSGRWVSQSQQGRKITLVIDGDSLTLISDPTARFSEPSFYCKGKIRVDSQATPKHLDFLNLELFLDGKTYGQPETSLGIYELKGDSLRIGHANPGQARPTQFLAFPASNTYKRIPPPPANSGKSPRAYAQDGKSHDTDQPRPCSSDAVAVEPTHPPQMNSSVPVDPDPDDAEDSTSCVSEIQEPVSVKDDLSKQSGATSADLNKRLQELLRAIKQSPTPAIRKRQQALTRLDEAAELILTNIRLVGPSYSYRINVRHAIRNDFTIEGTHGVHGMLEQFYLESHNANASYYHMLDYMERCIRVLGDRSTLIEFLTARDQLEPIIQLSFAQTLEYHTELMNEMWNRLSEQEQADCRQCDPAFAFWASGERERALKENNRTKDYAFWKEELRLARPLILGMEGITDGLVETAKTKEQQGDALYESVKLLYATGKVQRAAETAQKLLDLNVESLDPNKVNEMRNMVTLNRIFTQNVTWNLPTPRWIRSAR